MFDAVVYFPISRKICLYEQKNYRITLRRRPGVRAVWVCCCGRTLFKPASSNLAGDMDICVLRVLRVEK